MQTHKLGKPVVRVWHSKDYGTILICKLEEGGIYEATYFKRPTDPSWYDVAYQPEAKRKAITKAAKAKGPRK